MTTDAARARALIHQHGWNATAYQLLNPGIRHWYPAAGDALVGYVTRARTHVVAGAPVCAPERLADVVREFGMWARASETRVCYFGAGDRLQQLLLGTGAWSAASLGAQPSWHPAGWPAILARRASLRAQLNRARNKGVRVREWSAAEASGSAALRRCLAQWLETRGLPPLHFLVEPMTLGDLDGRRIYVAECGGDAEPAGFLIASPVPARRGWLVEQIIRGRRAPNGTAELLLDAAMRTLAAGGAEYLTLGLAPLSRHSRFDRGLMPAWLRLALPLVRGWGRRFYNFEGLDSFKAKFEPEEWEEIVALADAKRFPPRALWAIAAAFSAGNPLLLVVRALWRAARQESRWAATKLWRRAGRRGRAVP